MEMMPYIYGYHVNDKERCLKFLSNEEFLIISEDTYWMGEGMYFWDNVGNSKYWKSVKLKQDGSKEYLTVQANIFIDEDKLLDLTDEEQVELIERYWELYCKLDKCDKNPPLGIKIDKLVKFLEEHTGHHISIIKAIGDYNINQNKFDYLRYNNKFNGPQIRGNLRTIYCIRDYNIVKARKIKE